MYGHVVRSALVIEVASHANGRTGRKAYGLCAERWPTVDSLSREYSQKKLDAQVEQAGKQATHR